MEMKEIVQSKTPELLYNAINKYSATSKDLSPEDVYREARNAVVRFRKVYCKLPDLPDHSENAVAGLQELMDWCVRAIDIVDNIVDDVDRNVIEGFIRNLNKLKGLPASGFPMINKDVWKKAENKAQRICDKYQRGKKRPKRLSIFDYCAKRTRYRYAVSIISSLADVADRKAGRPNRWSHIMVRNSITADPLSKQIDDAYTGMYFYREVEKIYRLMDSDYNIALAKLEERISVTFKEWNKLNATDTDGLIDKYDELKGIELKERVVRLVNAYSIDAIVDTALFGSNARSVFGGETREALVDGIIETLHNISSKIKEKSLMKQSKNREKAKGSVIAMPVSSSEDNWEAIKSEYGISKKDFGKKINFVKDSFKRKVIFRDVEHAFVLASQGFSKPAIILAGGVIEELLKQYLKYKSIRPKCDKFFAYIEACENNNFLKRGVSRLTDSIRDFRNMVHLDNEKARKDTVSKATAKGAVASIFTIANDFQ